jgi:hypothetical protein
MAKAKANGQTAGGSVLDDPQHINRTEGFIAEFERAAAVPAAVVKPITLPRLDIRTLRIPIVGDSELIVHRWSEKARKEMLDKQRGVATAGKAPKDPEEDYKSSMYEHPDGGHGFPSIAFKNAAVSACTSLGKSISKVAARQAFHVVGEFVRIEGEPRMREDMVKIGMGTADIRFRAGFPVWSTEVTVRFNARVLTDEQVVNLFNTAGFAVGVGEWRSERDGSFGLFHVG